MTTPASPPSPAVIRGWIAAAGRAISPHFPLETFIARNPSPGTRTSTGKRRSD